jgi:hypothetical protein
MKKALKTNRPTPAPEREEELEGIAGRLARARVHARRKRPDRDAQVDNDIKDLWHRLAFDFDNPDAQEKDYLKKCCVDFLDGADLARLPTGDEVSFFCSAYGRAASREASLLEPDATAKRTDRARRKVIGATYHKQASEDPKGRTIADLEADFRRWFKLRKTASGAALELSKETGGAFARDAIRKHAARHNWTVGQR